MPGRTSLFALLTLTFSAAITQAASITVWDQTGYRGASTEIEDSVRSLSPYGWDNRISSLRVDSGQWEVCRDTDFRGCRTLTADEIDSLESTWNDSISSIRPLTATVAASVADSHEQTAQRVYRALLGRDADPGGLRAATTQVAHGQLESLVRDMAQSAEHRRLRASRSPTDLLDQIYRALLERPADSSARRTYLAALERGGDADVVLELLSSDEYLSIASGAMREDEDLSLEAEGDGLVVWGANGKYEALSSVTATLARDGKARLDLTGATTQTLVGTWSREADDLVTLRIPDVAGRRLNANGMLLLDNDRLARFEMIAGKIGAASSALMTFVSADYEPPREELACHQETRAQLEEERGAPLVMLFLQPKRSRVSTSRDEISGDAFTLSGPSHFTYTCDVDTRRGQVLDASIRRR